MFRRRALIVTGSLIVAAIVFLAMRNPHAPQFRKLASFTNSSYALLSYPFLNQRSFDGGQVWLHLVDNTNKSISVLFDIEQRKVVGELIDAWPEFRSADRSRLLCATSERTTNAFSWLKAVVQSVVLSRKSASDTVANYWVLDLSRNRATFIGQIAGSHGPFHPSPDLRLGFTKAPGGSRDLIYVCDLEQEKMREVRVAGWPSGWWDDRRLIMLSTNENIFLFDVVTLTSRPLVAATNIAAFLDANHIDRAGHQPRPFTSWNGTDFECYITDTHKRWLAQESFLLKIHRPDGRLSVISPRFKFEWSDSFHPTQPQYIFTGRQQGESNDAVFLRSLKTGTNTTLVPSAGNRRFSIPRIYRDSVIYIRSNALWRIDLTGSNSVRLFP